MLAHGSRSCTCWDRTTSLLTSFGDWMNRRERLATVAYVEQMERAYAAADLMLARSGAGTVLETAAVGLPAVFVPYPHGNGEQARNASWLSRGGGIMLADSNCTSAWVAEKFQLYSRTWIGWPG